MPPTTTRRRGSAHVRVTGLKELKAKLTPAVYDREVGRIIESGLNILQRKVESREPRSRTGRLHSGIVQVKGWRRPLRYGKVTIRAKNPRDGFRYPFALDSSRVIAYRSGRRKLFNWFRGSRSAMRREIQALVMQAAANVKSGWFR